MAFGKHARAETATVDIGAQPELLFARLDDQARLGAHMEDRSMMMMGGRMTYSFDAAGGRAVGSVIRMGGNVLGIPLSVEEVITERDPPRRKVWETIGQPRILVIGDYRMGFEIAPIATGSRLTVFIHYNHPVSLLGQVLGFLLGKTYARWCIERMAADAASAFTEPGATAARTAASGRPG